MAAPRRGARLVLVAQVEHEAADHETRDDIRERSIDEFYCFLEDGDVRTTFHMMDAWTLTNRGKLE